MTSKKNENENLRERIQTKIINAQQRNHLTEDDVYNLTKEFFSELLKLDYQYTHEELITELKKTYIEKQDFNQAESFIKKIGIVEFTSSQYDQKQLRNMIQELQDIIQRLTPEPKKTTLWTRLRQQFKRKEKVVKNSENEKEQALQILMSHMKDARSETEKHTLYHSALAQYEKLTDDTKVLFYHDLLSMYYTLQDRNKEIAPGSTIPQDTSDNTLVQVGDEAELTEVPNCEDINLGLQEEEKPKKKTKKNQPNKETKLTEVPNCEDINLGLQEEEKKPKKKTTKKKTKKTTKKTRTKNKK